MTASSGGASRPRGTKAGKGSRSPKRRHLSVEDLGRIRYNDPDFLRQFLTSKGRIRPRAQTGLSRRDQVRLARAVKVARELALLPYVMDVQEGERRGRRRG